MAGAGITINFKDGQKFTADQKHRLGLVIPDESGDLWTYVQLAEGIGYGDLCRDSVGADLIGNSGIATLTEAGEIGTYFLKVDDEFATDEDKWLRGAIGWIHEGAAKGTAFYVRKWVDADTLQIELLASPTQLTRGGLSVATATSTKFSLWMPGLVRKGTVTGISRGFAQAAGKKGEFGFLKQTRWGVCKVDASGAALSRGQGLVPAAGGLVAGYAGTPSALNVDRRVARWGFEDLDGTNDTPGWADLNIDNKAYSYSFSDDEHAINQVVIS